MAVKRKILIVEDEEAIRDGLVDVFVYHGFEVQAESTGDGGLAAAKTKDYDLLLLDVMLPGVNGFDICNAIRQNDPRQPIIMLTAKVTDEDIVNGLRMGADDYIGKPFSVQELVLRVEAVLRRAGIAKTGAAAFSVDSSLRVDPANLQAELDGEQIVFTRREMSVLEYLYAHRERAVPREELLSEVWGYAPEMDIETRTVDIHIAKLRRKIETTPRTRLD